jgi:hypothetical protein
MHQLQLSGEPVYGQGWLELLESQVDSGAFAGPGLSLGASRGDVQHPQSPFRDERDDPGWREFAENYHTTLVVLLAIRTALWAG